MEQLRIQRTPVRSGFTRTLNLLKEACEGENPDLENIETLFEQLSEKGKKLEKLDEEILKLLLAENVSQEEYEKEFVSCDSYSEKLIAFKIKVKKILSKPKPCTAVGMEPSSFNESGISRHGIRLPEITLKPFNGDLREWLNFWNSFRKIHEDQRLDEHSKFIYLIQATTPKSKAREIVESFPMTAENYSQAIQHLKQRFGRDDCLIQVYIRDLLQLVLKNNSGAKGDSVSSLYDSLKTKLRALESLGVTEDKYESILFPLVESSLPEALLRVWQRDRYSTDHKGKSELNSLLEFLKNEVNSEERVMLARTGFELGKIKKNSVNCISCENIDNVATAADLYNVNKRVEETCIFCEKSHASDKCFKASSLTYEVKRNLIMKKGACFSCLRKNHLSRNCKAKLKCIVCSKRHLTLMCPNISTQVKDRELVPEEKESKANTLTNQSTTFDVLLQTLIVRLKYGNREKIVRAIIDTGSEKTYLTEDVITYLKCEKIGEIKLVHKLFGGVETKEKLHHKYEIGVSSIDNIFKCKLHCLDQSIICSDIRKVPSGPWIRELNKYGIKISDIENNPLKAESEIKLLIGSDVAGKLLIGNVKSLNSGPVAVETRLGWTLMGKIPSNSNNSEINNSLVVTSLLLKDCSIAELWKLDVIGISDPVESKTKAEINEETMQHFQNTLSVDTEGRYEVALPWVVESYHLPSNRKLAERRLATTQRKLLDKDKTDAYQEVFNVWLSNQIIEVVSDEMETHVHYLPHRPVFKETSETCKIRPVFDASARNKSSPSLNDCLEKGPNLIEMIPSILNRFRKFPVGVISDIEKAFLQIGVRENDRDYLRFLWSDNENECKIYRHRRVVFGVNCSPFLLVATLNYHLNNVPGSLSPTAQILKESFYVDNCVCSLKTVQEADKFILESQVLLSSAKFNLRGWQSNYPVKMIEHCERTEPVPVLGLLWDLENDTLSCKIDSKRCEQTVVTKRILLSLAHSVFDPIGFSNPVTLLPKLILQKTWTLKLKWDEELPSELSKQFLNWVTKLHLLLDVKIPRWINMGKCVNENLSLHIFCDASSRAYATCVFLRVEANDNVHVNLVQSRCRVSPLKKITIPRLELLACCIGARLGNAIITDLGIADIDVTYWTDSTTVLSWIERDVQWGTFVWNRVQEIRKLTQTEQWRHVPGKVNPADLLSRGCSPEQFLELKWWEGPSWLFKPACNWPKSSEMVDEELVNSEKRKSVLTAQNSATEPSNWYFKYFSSYLKTIRLLAWIIRFINNLRKINVTNAPDLTYSEMENAERSLLGLIQKDAFKGYSDEKIRTLTPVVDQFGLIRAKTKIIYREDTENFKFPIILPSDHPVVHMLITWKHKELLHAGVSLLMTTLRETYWILRARKTIRKVIQRCVQCKRFNAQKSDSVPASLPTDRVKDAAIFQIVGVDLAGPLYLKGGRKSWIVLYTCAVYRAIHLELVTSLSSEAFLQTLRRFIARRGRPSTIYSDNGLNFVGTNSALSNIDWDLVASTVAVQKIHWKFNPPTAAWWGGWWERLIQMLKRILRKILGRASLCYEELLTVLCDCEQIINSRPLTYVTEDVNDLSPLTPSMFLQELRSSDVVDIDAIDNQELNKRSRYRQKIRDHLRQRFRSEYLGQLRQYSLNKKLKPLNQGDVVLVEGNTKKRAYWSLARVIELLPGKDGHPRVARIKTESGELLRPIQRLYSLELQEQLPDCKSSEIRTRSGRKVTVPDRFRHS